MVLLYILEMTPLLKINMESINQITGELFVSVDEVYHALDELKLPEGYVTTIKRQQRRVKQQGKRD